MLETARRRTGPRTATSVCSCGTPGRSRVTTSSPASTSWRSASAPPRAGSAVRRRPRRRTRPGRKPRRTRRTPRTRSRTIRAPRIRTLRIRGRSLCPSPVPSSQPLWRLTTDLSSWPRAACGSAVGCPGSFFLRVSPTCPGRVRVPSNCWFWSPPASGQVPVPARAAPRLAARTPAWPGPTWCGRSQALGGIHGSGHGEDLALQGDGCADDLPRSLQERERRTSVRTRRSWCGSSRRARRASSSSHRRRIPRLGRLEAFLFQQAIPPVFHAVYPYPGRVNVRYKRSVNGFPTFWLKNLKAQGFGRSW